MKAITLNDAHMGQDRYGDRYDAEKITILCHQKISNEAYFEQRGKEMSKDLDRSTEIVSESVSRLSHIISKMVDAEKTLSESSKTVSTSVRQATDKLAQGVARIEKQANFDRLAIYVELLERADKAMTSLAEMESKGKLAKIADALK